MPTKPKWDLEKIKRGFESFYQENNRYPTSHEIDNYPYLPSARQMQRVFGGLVELRKKLELKGPINFTEGEYSSQRAFKINRRAQETEQAVYDYLKNHFGKEFVHREHFFTDDRRHRTDFFVYHNEGNFSVDVFHPKDRYCFLGCLNSKLKTHDREIDDKYPTIFLMMNPELSAEEIKKRVLNKKNPLRKNQNVMAFEEFKYFCEGKKSLSVKRSGD